MTLTTDREDVQVSEKEREDRSNAPYIIAENASGIHTTPSAADDVSWCAVGESSKLGGIYWSMTAPTYEILQVAPPGSPERQTHYDQCIQVRIEVFVHEQQFPLETEVDDVDAFATHFLLRLVPSGTPIGTIRVHKPTGASYYKLTRLVVVKQYRKHHFGAALVERAHQFAVHEGKTSGQTGVVEVVLHSQIHAKPFYARFGYLPEGDEFEEDGAPHQKMKVYLSTL